MQHLVAIFVLSTFIALAAQAGGARNSPWFNASGAIALATGAVLAAILAWRLVLIMLRQASEAIRYPRGRNGDNKSED